MDTNHSASCDSNSVNQTRCCNSSSARLNAHGLADDCGDGSNAALDQSVVIQTLPNSPSTKVSMTESWEKTLGITPWSRIAVKAKKPHSGFWHELTTEEYEPRRKCFWLNSTTAINWWCHSKKSISIQSIRIESKRERNEYSFKWSNYLYWSPVSPTRHDPRSNTESRIETESISW
jgi:hypothetical protein